MPPNSVCVRPRVPFVHPGPRSPFVHPGPRRQRHITSFSSCSRPPACLTGLSRPNSNVARWTPPPPFQHHHRRLDSRGRCHTHHSCQRQERNHAGAAGGGVKETGHRRPSIVASPYIACRVGVHAEAASSHPRDVAARRVHFFLTGDELHADGWCAPSPSST
jgi:hypothetical protein